MLDYKPYRAGVTWMRREKLNEAIEVILADLQVSGMAKMFKSAFDSDRVSKSDQVQRASWVNLKIITDYFNRYQSYDDDKKWILKVLGLSEIADPDIWQEHLFDPPRSFVFHVYQRIKNAEDILPRILQLISISEDRGSELAGEVHSETEYQTVILTDERGSFSTPDRLIALLEAIRDIYRTVARIEGLEENTIAVTRLDSGSEKSFDFLGLAKVMSHLNDLLSNAYTMIAFHRQNITLKNLEAASSGLDIIAKIDDLEKSGALSSEEAGFAKHSLFKSVMKFAETGAYTPEMIVQPIPPEALMRPAQKLLTGPKASEEGPLGVEEEEVVSDANDDSDADLAEFTQEELAAAAKALREIKNAKSEGATEQPVDDPSGKRPTRKRRPQPPRTRFVD